MLYGNTRTKLLSGSALASMAAGSMAFFANAHASSFEITDPTAFNTVNVEDIINTLPQFQPAFDSSSNNPGNGRATINLRGLGTQRNLVLIDGLRIANFGDGNTVDLNAIPAALIERIDILTGEGAVAYGEGAVGGVVNLILKNDFEGLSLDTSYELSAQEWDAGIFNVALTAGKNFAGGRGHAMLSASYTDRNSVLQGSRDFSSNVFFDPGTNGSELIVGGSTNIPGTRFRGSSSSNFGLTTSEIEAIDPNCVNNTCSGLFIDEAGNTRGLRFGPFGAGTDQTTDLYNYAPSNFLQLPQERFNITGSASFEIAPFAELYVRGLYTQNDTATQRAPEPTGTLFLDINLDNPFLAGNPQLLGIITNDFTSNNGDGTATVRINRRLNELGENVSEFDSEHIQLATGFRGGVGENISYDAYFNYGRSETRQTDRGDFSIPAFQSALLCDGGPTAIASGCTAPAANIFGGPGSLSAEAANFIGQTNISLRENTLLQTGLNLSFESKSGLLPWTSKKALLNAGIEYREIDIFDPRESIPDLRLFGISASDPIPVSTRRTNYDIFGHFNLPLASGLPFVRDLSISGGGRWSDYNNIGSVWSYEGRGQWQPYEGLSFFGGYQQAHRLPNAGELFSEQRVILPGVTDPCSGGTFNPNLALVIPETCILTGVPEGQVGAGLGGGISPVAILGGNPDLREERSRSITAGLKIEPAFIPALSISAEYFNIEVFDLISSVNANFILNGCHLQGILDFCGRVNRDSGTLIGVDATAINTGELQKTGLDFGVTYSSSELLYGGRDLGLITLDYVATLVLEDSFEVGGPLGVTSITSCEGLFSGTCGEPTPEYSHNFQLKHQFGPLTTNLRWRHIGGVDFDPLSGQSPSDLSDNINSFNYVDVEMQYSLTNNAAINLGVRNITGEEPPVLGSTFSEQANTFPATYETLGRQVFAGVSVKF